MATLRESRNVDTARFEKDSKEKAVSKDIAKWLDNSSENGNLKIFRVVFTNKPFVCVRRFKYANIYIYFDFRKNQRYDTQDPVSHMTNTQNNEDKPIIAKVRRDGNGYKICSIPSKIKHISFGDYVLISLFKINLPKIKKVEQ